MCSLGVCSLGVCSLGVCSLGVCVFKWQLYLFLEQSVYFRFVLWKYLNFLSFYLCVCHFVRGVWYTHVTEVITCADPGAPVNGRKMLQGLSYNNTVTFSCDTGFNLTGMAVQHCAETGKWSATQPTCVGEYSFRQDNSLFLAHKCMLSFPCSKSVLCPFITLSGCTLHCYSRRLLLHSLFPCDFFNYNYIIK